MLILIAQVSLATSPTDTSKVNNDIELTVQLDTNSKSLVCLELGVLNKTIIDLETGDAAKAKIIIFEVMNGTCVLKVEQTEKLLKEEKTKAKVISFEYEREITTLNGLVDAKGNQIIHYQKEAKKYKNQKKWIIVGGITISVGLVVGVIYLSTL